jgi:multidrug efflux pump
LSVAVLLSFVEAVTLAPTLCAQFLNTSRENRRRVGRKVDAPFTRLSGKYRVILAWALARPGRVLAAAALLFAVSIFGMTQLPSEFVPTQDQSLLVVGFKTAETDQLIQQAERFLMSRPEVERVYAVVGGFSGEGNEARMYPKLVPPTERDMGHLEAASLIRSTPNAIPGLRTVVQDLSQSGFSSRRGFPVEFSVRGPDWEARVNSSRDVMMRLEESGLVVDRDTDYKLGMPELHILPDRARAADLGVPIEDVATTINAMVGGLRVGKYSSGGRRIDVRVRLLADQRSRPEDIGYLRVRTASGDQVPLSTWVHLEERPVLQEITRRDRERAITITANVPPGHAQDEALAFVEGLGKGMPIGTRIVLEGASVEFRDSMGGLLFALLLGILVAYMVLGSQFNSFLHPITVLTILPLSVVGALIALMVGGKSLNIFSMIGLVLLMGIVKKNSIILVDYANQLREQGHSAIEAMMLAGPVRLRPILMTAAATMMAALPPALGLGAGAEIRTPMAMAVIGGLIVSTGLSLLVVPAFYTLTDGLGQRIRGWMGRSRNEIEEEVHQAQALD